MIIKLSQTSLSVPSRNCCTQDLASLTTKPRQPREKLKLLLSISAIECQDYESLVVYKNDDQHAKGGTVDMFL